MESKNENEFKENNEEKNGGEVNGEQNEEEEIEEDEYLQELQLRLTQMKQERKAAEHGMTVTIERCHKVRSTSPGMWQMVFDCRVHY